MKTINMVPVVAVDWYNQEEILQANVLVSFSSVVVMEKVQYIIKKQSMSESEIATPIIYTQQEILILCGSDIIYTVKALPKIPLKIRTMGQTLWIQTPA